MHREVWAPRAREVTVLRGERRYPLAPRDDGWFSGSLEDLRQGDRYDLELDGQLVRPDPLARRLPDGVNGPAQVWEPGAYAWQDAGWTGRGLAGGVVYELHVGTFTPAGTFAAAADRLDHLVTLGVTHVELMPVTAFDGVAGWGYDGVAIDAVHEPYGGPDALCAFVDACHRAGLAVLLDVVHNHLGPSGNSWERFGPFLTDKHHTPWGAAVNLDDTDSDAVRAILVGSALGWLRDFHLDGLRLDAVHELHDERATHYLTELAAAVEQLSTEVGRPLTLIAESDRNDPRTISDRRAYGLGLTAQWDDDVHHALHWLLTGESAGYYADFASCEAVGRTLERGFRHEGGWSSFRGRSHGAPIDWAVTDPWRLVVSLQTHDQVGNRARGERLRTLAGLDRCAAGAVLLAVLPYTPMLFMGEEWGADTPWRFFSSFPDPELGRAVTEGRRQEFAAHGWDAEEIPDPQDPATVAASRLDWDEPARPREQELLGWYRTLLALRAAEPGLGAGWARPGASADGVRCSWGASPDGRPDWFAVHRGPWFAVANLASEAVEVPLPAPLASVAAWWGSPAPATPSSERLTLPQDASALLHLRASLLETSSTR